MIGIEEREYNGIKILRLHYTADPAKQTPEWKTEAHRALSEREWRREYEIDWTIASGLPVYADVFIRELHIAKQPLLAHPNLPMYRGWDFGLTPACVWGQLDPMGRLNILAEMVTWDGRGEMKQMGIERFAPGVIVRSNERWPNVEWKDRADPAGWTASQTDEKTCVQIMQDLGIYPSPGPVTFTDRKRYLTNLLERMVGGRAAIMISPDCHMVIEGLAGAYRYEKIGETGRYKQTVEKNAWSHPINGLEYMVGSIYANTTRQDDEEERGIDDERSANRSGIYY